MRIDNARGNLTTQHKYCIPVNVARIKSAWRISMTALGQDTPGYCSSPDPKSGRKCSTALKQSFFPTASGRRPVLEIARPKFKSHIESRCSLILASNWSNSG